MIVRLFRTPAASEDRLASRLATLRKAAPDLASVQAELSFYIQVEATLDGTQLQRLRWLLADPEAPDLLTEASVLPLEADDSVLIEIGPRLNFSTAFSTNAVSICKSVGLPVVRLEVATRYLLRWPQKADRKIEQQLVSLLHDRMTECRYATPLTSFDLDVRPQPWFEVDVLGRGQEALKEVDKKLGLAFDPWDLQFYCDLFGQRLKRNPTSVECFDLAQSNSEHSRHWFFKGKVILDGVPQDDNLFDLVIRTQKHSNQNNVIRFNDNSSAIEGFKVTALRPTDPTVPSPFNLRQDHLQHIVFTAETHNFPTGVAPFSGATTGTGGRLRDVHAVGRGGHYIAGTTGYSFGALHIPGYKLPWEDASLHYPSNFAPPLEIAVEASNGASDYGNKFGEPLVCGFVRSFGLVLPDGERREYVKPIMFSGGIGALDHDQVTKLAPEKGMEVVKVGGPVYRIGVGGGAASSVEVQGDNSADLDFGAVQRGDAEMEQKLHRVIRACLEHPQGNPICSIHDQGAGGNGNVLKELVEPAGAVIYADRFQLGDPTISTLELWGAEYQENDALLCRAGKDADLLRKVAKREKCPVDFVGTVTGDGQVRLLEAGAKPGDRPPVDLDLALVLGKMPPKKFDMRRANWQRPALSLPTGLTVQEALERVLRLPSVGSKRWLTNKVDRSVTGLVAQQQCVGPQQAPLADAAVIALSYWGNEGAATSIGEQPIKGLVDPSRGARMTVAEALTNLATTAISDLRDVKCSGNWMWAAKLEGEGAALWDACAAMCDLMAELGVAIDGGKDSLSMAARVEGKTVKAPGTLVVSCYAPCPDVRKVATPDLKLPGHDALLFVDLSGGHSRLGGSALAQCWGQVGNESPDVENPKIFVDAFEAIQHLVACGVAVAGHDISDGGLLVTAIEMAIGGCCGLQLSIDHKTGQPPLAIVFAEEVGWLIEVAAINREAALAAFRGRGVPCYVVGMATSDRQFVCKVNGVTVLDTSLSSLVKLWEETSYQLELRQANGRCVAEEFEGLVQGKTLPQQVANFEWTPRPPLASKAIPIAVLREEGVNGDREMVASLITAGFEVWDVTVSDLLAGYSLAAFRGLIFPGGFSYADVLGSAKGWAGALQFHPSAAAQLATFFSRPDTFSLGVCNGCQLMALLGWSGKGVALRHNDSERFESRFTAVRIEKGASEVWLKDMEGSVLGVWVAHGEGRLVGAPENRVALRYVDSSGQPTQEYPFNPNGSPNAVAGLASPNGRHLAMMPHPERCVRTWQLPFKPSQWSELETAPWQKMFNNAYIWASK
ncbi:phosphoribosylformylglycinamidine synthase [Neocloeon triangulifer]|uniref:phosphoribosylformylglycinamidine synthase n=1 Tax=Neocloeon triangulifer TaxID=2078957 RepID=UPI00286F5ADB|nr:phosphoribosylformylglycinamidine synthase [Neocloeon triangulifer]XP_059470475.1 phosphoribosylformylglycinamidine synthase [Neocloeon triangulifer]